MPELQLSDAFPNSNCTSSGGIFSHRRGAKRIHQTALDISCILDLWPANENSSKIKMKCSSESSVKEIGTLTFRCS